MRYGWLVVCLFGCTLPEVQEWAPGTPWDWEDVSEPTELVSGFMKPMGLCVTTAGDLWVADEVANSVQRVSIEGDVVAEISELNAPRWLACGDGLVVISESGEDGHVHVYQEDGAFVQTLSDSPASWGRPVYGDGVFSWTASGGTDLYQWDGSEVVVHAFSSSIQAVIHTPSGWLVAAGPQSPWVLMDLSKEVWGTSPYGVRDLEWHDGELWGSTRSPRWPYGGWIVRWDTPSAALVQYSPPEPGPMTLVDSVMFWGSKQSLTRYALEDDAYEAIALQTAVAEVISVGSSVYWTDYQRGVLLTWTD